MSTKIDAKFAAVDLGAAQAEPAQAAPALVDLLMDADEADQIERAAGLLEDYHRFIGEHVKSDDLVLHPYPPEIEGAAEELRAIVARIGEFKPTTDYQLGHADALEWAAQVVEANDPRTGDWLHDDRSDLANALRKGPELPAAAAQAAPVVPMTQAAQDVLAERRRQIETEGYDASHDDEHVNDEIAAYAALYAMPEGARDWDASMQGYAETLGEAMLPNDWTMPDFGDDRRVQLVKAGALILAEIERLDRATPGATHGNN